MLRAEGLLSDRQRALIERLGCCVVTLSNVQRGKIVDALARTYHAQGRYADAEPLYKRSLAIFEKALGPDHPDVAASLNNLAEVYRAQGKYAAAEPLYKRSLAIGEKVLGPKHPDVANSLNNLAELYRAQGKYAEAGPLYKRSLAIQEKALGAEHPNVAQSLNNLALLYQAQGKYTEAEPLYKRSLAIYEKVLGSEHPHVAPASATWRSYTVPRASTQRRENWRPVPRRSRPSTPERTRQSELDVMNIAEWKEGL